MLLHLENLRVAVRKQILIMNFSTVVMHRNEVYLQKSVEMDYYELNATKFERKFQFWWHLVSFTYDPINNMAVAFVFTIRNASLYVIYPITVTGLNHNGTTLYPLEHTVWAQQNGNKWLTVDVNMCTVQEEQGFICEE